MGIVKISEGMHENLRVASNALSRSINAQAEHWMRIGMLTELHPNLDHSDICRLLIRAEQAGGLDLQRLCALADLSQSPEAHAVSGAKQ
ncbi:ParD-like family protein [Pseudomonas sp. XS1P51]